MPYPYLEQEKIMPAILSKDEWAVLWKTLFGFLHVLLSPAYLKVGRCSIIIVDMISVKPTSYYTFYRELWPCEIVEANKDTKSMIYSLKYVGC